MKLELSNMKEIVSLDFGIIFFSFDRYGVLNRTG
jgi:hypothetical protein